MLLTASMNDVRVNYWEAVKWVYQMRHVKCCPNSTLLLKLSESDGHFGGGGRLEQMQEAAMEYAFLYHALKRPFPKRK